MCKMWSMRTSFKPWMSEVVRGYHCWRRTKTDLELKLVFLSQTGIIKGTDAFDDRRHILVIDVFDNLEELVVSLRTRERVRKLLGGR